MSSPAARQTPADLIDLIDATDTSLCGGKAAGLAVLQRSGCAVPAGTCLTTHFYRRWLRFSGLEPRLAHLVKAAEDPAARREVLETIRGHVEAMPLPDVLQAGLRNGDGSDHDHPELVVVRSSGVQEDGGAASHAGIHESVVVAAGDREALIAAVKRCWASLWTDGAWTYRERFAIPHDAAALAVVVQRFVPAASSGVAFSADPLTGDPATVVIEACWGTAGDLVGGTMTPDEYRVSETSVRRRPGRQTTMIAWRDARRTIEPIDGARRDQSVLSDAQAHEVVRLVKDAERAIGQPVDVEWVFDGTRFWIVQARPITTGARHAPPTLWTRANVKEVFPELPSPLALSYLKISMDRMFRAYYAAAGYALAESAELVAVIRSRPYLNLSLMQGVAIARGGDPAVVSRLFGGAPPAHAGPAAPPSAPKLSFPEMVRLAREMYATFFRTPARGQRLFRTMRREAAALNAVPLESLDDRALLANFRRMEMTIIREQTLRGLHEVISAQPRAYMVLEAFLTAWLPADADTLLKRLMTGLGTLPNVKMVHHVMDLAALAVADDRARAYFAAELDLAALADYERALAGTAVLPELRAFLREFGHRAPYESDAMSARFADDPAPVLRMIQLHVRAGATVSGDAHGEERRQVRLAAMAAVRGGLRGDKGPFTGWMRLRVFSLVCRTLQRLIALRDECRHVTTMHVAHLRRVTLEFGRRAVAAGIVDHRDDVFFLDWDELPRIIFEPRGDWRPIVAERRRRREADAQLEAPNILGGERAAHTAPAVDANGALFGYGVSPGVVTGSVRVLRSAEAIGRLSGEIVVFPAIEPMLTPIFPLVTGIIAEMGGLLSHAAILAREYGVPAVVSVQDATRRLKDGDRIELDGTTGRIRVLEPAGSASR